ncbi:MAG: hypothetical protein QM749_14170 [Aquabacterium sp.]
MHIDPQAVLAIVAAILFALALSEFIRQRRITPGIKGRVITAGLFVLVLCWLHWQGQ